jgi:hypothetical protein
MVEMGMTMMAVSQLTTRMPAMEAMEATVEMEAMVEMPVTVQPL